MHKDKIYLHFKSFICVFMDNYTIFYLLCNIMLNRKLPVLRWQMCINGKFARATHFSQVQAKTQKATTHLTTNQIKPYTLKTRTGNKKDKQK